MHAFNQPKISWCNHQPRNGALYKAWESRRNILVHGCLPVDEKERVGGSWLGRKVFPRPACPEPASWEHGAHPGILPVHHPLYSTPYVWCMHAQVMWNTISNAPPARGFLLEKTRKKRGRTYCTRRRWRRLPDCWCHLQELASKWVDRGMSVSWTGRGRH